MASRKFRSQRRKKRKFAGNRHTAVNSDVSAVLENLLEQVDASFSTTASADIHQDDFVDIHIEVESNVDEADTSSNLTVPSLNSTASYSKLVNHPVIPNELENTPTLLSPSTSTSKANFKDSYQIIHTSVLESITTALACPECLQVEAIEVLKLKKQGLAVLLQLHCTSCEWSHEFWTSKKPCKVRSFDINKRIVYAMRRIGKGYAGIKTFLTLMNLPPPMTKTNYQKLTKKIHKAVKIVADECTKAAAQEIISSDQSGSNVVDTGISNDGAWQKRGFSSLNGNVATISVKTGRIIDYETMSRYCQLCDHNKHLKQSDPEKFEAFMASHETHCMLNHKGSAAAMEVAGTKRIFDRSITKNNLRYTEFLGDGDTKSFNAVENTYPGIKVNKLECIGHVQKRIGNRLRKLKKTVKGLGGKGRLTDASIDKLQNYYGIAIRRNVGQLDSMRKATHAALFHVASSANDNYHDHCPTGEKSWCQFQVDKVTGTTKYKPGPGLPRDVIKHVKPIFQELSQDSLLTKCLHGQTQNRNESFNATIWKRVPKDTYVGLRQFEIGVCDAVAHFNIGNSATIKIFRQLGMEPGSYTLAGCSAANTERVTNAARLSTEKRKLRRRIIRGRHKKKSDKNVEKEGDTYCPGGF